jgi:hypothetical protein
VGGVVNEEVKEEWFMVNVLSIHIWIWNIETCWIHFNNGEGELWWG